MDTQIAKLVPMKTATVTAYTTTVWIYVGPPAGCLEIPCAGTTWLVRKNIHFGTKTARTLIFMERNKQPWGFLPFIFFPLSRLSNISHPKKPPHLVRLEGRKSDLDFYSLISQGAQSSLTLNYATHLKASKKRDRVSTPTWLHFLSSCSFLSCQSSFLILLLREGGWMWVPRILIFYFFFSCV